MRIGYTCSGLKRWSIAISTFTNFNRKKKIEGENRICYETKLTDYWHPGCTDR
jgi:hypothetical protein